jgi:hypothetical protein
MKKRILLLMMFGALICSGFKTYGQTTLIAKGSSWNYLDTDTRPTNWETSSFNDASWSSGNLVAGYGTITGASISTTISYGSNSSSKYITTYFRKTINLSSPSYSSLDLNLLCDDGAVIYVNGVEVQRYNLPTGTISHSTTANSAVGGSDEGDYTTYNVSASNLVNGNNTIAVEIHQANGSSSDLGFDLEIIANGSSGGGGSGAGIIAKEASWKYLDNDTRPTSWEDTSFNDGSWSSGNAVAGYGTIDGASITTTIDYGSNSTAKYITTYFRKTVNLSNPSYPGGLELNLLCDDGAVVYLNGVELMRYNMPTGSVSHATTASSAVGGSDEGDYTAYTVSSSALKNGDNVFAVEIHQAAATSSDVGFDMEVTGLTSSNPTTYTLKNGPYLQMSTPTGIHIRWRTQQLHAARVYYGTVQGAWTDSADQAVSKTEHEVILTGLTPDTKYFYAIASTSGDLIQGASDNFFITPPTVGTEQKTRIWVLGDCGRGSSVQEDTKDAYYNYDASTYTDMVLLLGDNAYNSGTDSEYETKFFEYYDDKILKQSPLWPAPGNHDYGSASPARSQNCSYFDLFTLPTAGEAGGVASGQEAYYSFDHANIHFLSLDSYGEVAGDRMYDTTGAQATWVKQDLAATTQTWRIAYWHHPPFTMGSHNSDNEGELVEIREKFMRIMDRYDVDMILCGHSHCYERSKLIDGYYGNEGSFSTSTHELDHSTGRYDSGNNCPYTKTETDHDGYVFVVAGSSALASGTQGAWPHNAMYYADASNAGTSVIDVEGGRLDFKFLDRTGVVRDSFTMFKDIGKTKTDTIYDGDSLELKASWPGVHSWSRNSETTPSITVDSTTTTYVVTDGKGCISDTFNIVGISSTPPAPTCTDGIKNGNETGVDCGGPDCSACPTCSDGIQNGNETGVDCGGPDCNACPTCSDGILNGNETGVDCGGPDCIACPTCSDGIQNGNETGVDCGGPDCNACPTCSDGILNGNETGVDCGGPDCSACPTCSDGIQNGNETGVDCGGPDCNACPTCSDGILNGNETGVDCGGPDCSACPPTCSDGIKNGNETGVDCGGPDCSACPTCSDGTQNGNETGVDCGGPDCSACPTCSDGTQNGNETGVDCGGPDCAACPTCSDGIQNGNETGVDCGGPVCTACPTCSDGILNGNETAVDCGGPDCTACPTCSDGIQNGNETGVDCGGPDCSACPTCSDGTQNGNETGVDCGGPDCTACPTCSDGTQNGNETGVDCGGPDCAACPTCSDGTKNGNETGVDCGGPDCSACPSCTWGTIDDEDFDNGWGIWNDGGSDCSRSSRYSSYAYSGSYCIRLRDNSSSSVMTTDNLNLSNYEEIDISFTYITISMDNSNEDFFLEMSTNGGSSYSILEEWNYGDEFTNNSREFDSVNIQGPFTSNTRFRFRCDASGNSDWVYIDDVLIEGCLGSSSKAVMPVQSKVADGVVSVNPAKYYPNPVKDVLNVQFEKEIKGIYNYVIYDITGKSVMQGNFRPGQKEYNIGLEGISDGVYLIQLHDGNNWSPAARIVKH